MMLAEYAECACNALVTDVYIALFEGRHNVFHVIVADGCAALEPQSAVLKVVLVCAYTTT